MKKNIFLFLLIISTLTGCTDTYVKQPDFIPVGIKKIFIEPFINNLTPPVPGLENKLSYVLTQEFLADKRVEISTDKKNADAVLFGEITRYFIQPVSYNAQQVVEESKLSIWIDVGFKDIKSGEILWVEKRMLQEMRYFESPKPGQAVYTELEARDALLISLAKNIMKRTLDGWFAASGVSDKR